MCLNLESGDLPKYTVGCSPHISEQQIKGLIVDAERNVIAEIRTGTINRHPIYFELSSENQKYVDKLLNKHAINPAFGNSNT